MKITVTQKHINKGKRGACLGCPIALALLDKGIEAIVGLEDFSVGDAWYKLPGTAIQFRETFDNEGRNRVKPVSFIARREK